MSWSYDPNLSTDKDKVRFYIGDTDTTDQLISDEEINALLAEYSVYNAAAVACEHLAAKYARKADKDVGDLSISWSQISEQFSKKAKDLRRKAAFSGVAPYAGGISISDKDNVEANTDRVDPAFERNQFRNPKDGYDDDCERTC